MPYYDGFGYGYPGFGFGSGFGFGFPLAAAFTIPLIFTSAFLLGGLLF